MRQTEASRQKVRNAIRTLVKRQIELLFIVLGAEKVDIEQCNLSLFNYVENKSLSLVRHASVEAGEA